MTLKDLKGKRIGIAVSGGLDSCTITRWLSDNGVSVYGFTADLGQPDERNINDVKDRMLACGAKDCTIIDARKAVAEGGLKVIQAQAHYEGGYWNTTGIARYITVEAILPHMKAKNINIFGHGATGRGNDQVRFQLACNMLDPTMEVYAPWRDSVFLKRFPGRREMIRFCNRNKLPITATLDKPYSTDSNMLGLTHEAGLLEDLKTPVSIVEPGMGCFPDKAPDTPEVIEIEFDRGIPKEINGKKLSLVKVFQKANEIAGKNGIGIGIHAVENRFVGIKSRGVYESPAMELLGTCYELILQLTLDRRARTLFESLSRFVALQIYQGYWLDSATEMAMAALGKASATVSGKIRVKLYKGTISFEAIDPETVPSSMYSMDDASMEGIGTFDHADSEGFLKVLGISAKANATARRSCRDDGRLDL